jgi:flagellar biosynthesis protein FlhA
MVRKRLARTITDQHKNKNGKISAITLEPALEHQMTSTLRQEADSLNLALPAEIAMQISTKIAQGWKETMDNGEESIVLLCDSRLRRPLAAMLSRTVPPLPVMAYDEIVLGTEIEPIKTISIDLSQEVSPRERELVMV